MTQLTPNGFIYTDHEDYGDDTGYFVLDTKSECTCSLCGCSADERELTEEYPSGDIICRDGCEDDEEEDDEEEKNFYKVCTAECPDVDYFDTLQEAKDFCDEHDDLDYGYIMLCDADKNEIGDWGDYWGEEDCDCEERNPELKLQEYRCAICMKKEEEEEDDEEEDDEEEDDEEEDDGEKSEWWGANGDGVVHLKYATQGYMEDHFEEWGALTECKDYRERDKAEELQEQKKKLKYPSRCSIIDGEWKQYLGAGNYCKPELKVQKRKKKPPLNRQKCL